MSTSPTRFASRIIIKPIPAVQHPTNFTTARAALVAIGMYLPYLSTYLPWVPTKLNKCARMKKRENEKNPEENLNWLTIFSFIRCHIYFDRNFCHCMSHSYDCSTTEKDWI